MRITVRDFSAAYITRETIGNEGEKNSVTLKVYVQSLMESYPSAAFSIFIHRADGEEYIAEAAAYANEDGYLYYIFGEADLAVSGPLEVQILATESDTELLTRVYPFTVAKSLNIATTNPPPPTDRTWADELIAAALQTGTNKEAAQEAAQTAIDAADSVAAQAHFVAWSAGTTIVKGNRVSHNGSSYEWTLSTAGTGIEPPATGWVLIASKGGQGATGNDGPKGDTGNMTVYFGSEEPDDPDVNLWINTGAGGWTAGSLPYSSNATLGEKIEEQERNQAFVPNSWHQGNSVARAPMITFVDDDASSLFLTKLLPIMIAKGVAFVVASVANRMSTYLSSNTGSIMTFDEQRTLQNVYGVEIADHSLNHKTFIGMSEAEAIQEAFESKRVLEAQGLKIDNFVFPFNSDTAFMHGVLSRAFQCGASGGGDASINVPPISNSYSLKRMPFGEKTLAQYKAQVDSVKAQNGWGIYMLHCWMATHNETQMGYLADLIDYCAAQGVQVATLRQGIQAFGNAVEVSGRYVVTNQGVAHELVPEIPRFPVYAVESADLTTPITAFKKPSVSYTTITAAKAAAVAGAPAGIMQTVRGMNADESYGYQLVYAVTGNRVVRRRWNASTGAWNTFFDLSVGRTVLFENVAIGDVPANGVRGINITSPVSLTGLPFFLTVPHESDAVTYTYAPYGLATIRIIFRNSSGSTVTIANKAITVYFPTLPPV